MASRDQEEALKKWIRDGGAVRGESQVTDNGGDAKLVRAEYKAYGNGNKPTKGGLP